MTPYRLAEIRGLLGGQYLLDSTWLFNVAADLLAAIEDLAAQVEELEAKVVAAETARRFFAEGRDYSSLVERILELEKENDELNHQVMTVQTSSEYDLGYEHGDLVAAKYKAERDALAARLAAVCTCDGETCDQEGDPGCLHCQQIDCEWPCPAEERAARLDAAVEDNEALRARLAEANALLDYLNNPGPLNYATPTDGTPAAARTEEAP